jgi:hypothetical protein
MAISWMWAGLGVVMVAGLGLAMAALILTGRSRRNPPE